MLFNSYLFLFGFLPLVLAGCWSLRRKHARLAFLTAASWVFYAWWDWRFLPLLLSITAVGYVAALAISGTDDARVRRVLLAVALAVHLGLLGYFKYAGFFVDSLDGLGHALGLPVDLPALHILLPIGISFYTFNSMSYVIDVHWRHVEPTRDVLEYSTFVALFPHLIAGPIVRFGDLREQLRMPTRGLTWRAAGVGVFFLGFGLAKKLLLADQLDPFVDRLFAQPGGLGLFGSWAAALGYSLQLYFDFSGYSDMAVGLAWLIGFRFPQNFNSPFKARNISDFWRRWHMSLSSWIRDYVFTPLGVKLAHLGVLGHRPRRGLGPLRMTVDLMVTMFLVGLWHGAAWTFVVWGLVHGVGMSVHELCRAARLTPRSRVVNRTLTFLFVVAAFVIFRAPNLHVAGSVLAAMAGLHGVELPGRLGVLLPSRFLLLLLVLLVFVQAAPNTWQIRLRPRLVYGVVTGAVAAVAIMAIASPHPFIYFQF